jgi:hypothetical protein
MKSPTVTESGGSALGSAQQTEQLRKPLTKRELGDPWGRIENHLGLLVVVLSGFGRLFSNGAGKK